MKSDKSTKNKRSSEIKFKWELKNIKKISKISKNKKRNNKKRNIDNFVFKDINNAKNISLKVKKETKKENKC
jgi:uncharacterized protein YcbK (DUF882 family)